MIDPSHQSNFGHFAIGKKCNHLLLFHNFCESFYLLTCSRDQSVCCLPQTSRQPKRRITARDLLFYMEQTKETKKSLVLYKSLLKWCRRKIIPCHHCLGINWSFLSVFVHSLHSMLTNTLCKQISTTVKSHHFLIRATMIFNCYLLHRINVFSASCALWYWWSDGLAVGVVKGIKFSLSASIRWSVLFSEHLQSLSVHTPLCQENATYTTRHSHCPAHTQS